MTVDPDDRNWLLLENRTDRLADIAEQLSQPELLWAYWWQVLLCLLGLPSLRWMTLDRLMLEASEIVLHDVLRFL